MRRMRWIARPIRDPAAKINRKVSSIDNLVNSEALKASNKNIAGYVTIISPQVPNSKDDAVKSSSKTKADTTIVKIKPNFAQKGIFFIYV